MPRPERISSIFCAVEALPGRGRRPFQPLEHAILVALGLQPAQEPRAGVREPLVVEVDRVLRRQHDPQAEGPRLLEQREHRHLRRRIGRGGEVAEDLVHVEDGPQARRARLGPDPGQHLVQEDRDEEHPLVVREVRDRQDREPRLALARIEQAADVERLALHPAGEPGRGEQVVQLHRQGEPLLGREEGLQVDHADLLERRRLHGVDQARHVEVVAGAPGVIEHVREQDMLAAGDRIGVDPQERQQSRDGRRNSLAIGLGLADQSRRRGVERAKHRQRQPGTRSRRVDRQIDRVAEPRDPRAVLPPGSQPLLPGLGRLGGELLA